MNIMYTIFFSRLSSFFFLIHNYQIIQSNFCNKKFYRIAR
jgi:hypothetical protein